mmetsp:Transcript_18769/g.54005  ORF Transcript_18769/g.54005 Transcript_18769/m.54005 type:complete len:744 (-) Transcript_18769:425-2656(-)
MLGKDAANAREDGNSGGVGTSLLGKVLHKSGELIKEMVDNIGGKDSDAHIVGMVSGFALNVDIEGKDGSILRTTLFVHDGYLRHITLGNGTDTDGTDGNRRLGLLAKELEQGLKRTECTGLDHNTLLVGAQLVLDFGQIGHDLGLNVLLFIIGTDNHHGSSGHDLFEVITNQLDAKGSLDLLVMNVIGLDTHLSAGRRGEQTSDFGNDRAIESTEDGLVALAKMPIHKEHIYSSTETIDLLDLENCTLKVGAPHDLLPELPLGHLAEKQENVLNTFTGDGRGGNERDEVGVHPVIITHLPIQVGVHTLLRKLDLGIGGTGTEFRHGAIGLLLQGLPDGNIGAGLPCVASIDLVKRHDERSAPGTEHSETFNGLLFQTVHEIHNEDGNITEGRTTRTKVCEGLVTRRIDDEHTGDIDVELLRLVQSGRLRLQRLLLKEGGTNLLRNTTGLTALNVRLTDLIEQLGLAGIDMTHYDDDGTTQIVAGTSGQVDLLLLFSLFASLVPLLGGHHLLPVGLLLLEEHLLALFLLDALALGALQAQLTEALLFPPLLGLDQILIVVAVEVARAGLTEPLGKKVDLLLGAGVRPIVRGGIPLVAGGLVVPVITTLIVVITILLLRLLFLLWFLLLRFGLRFGNLGLLLLDLHWLGLLLLLLLLLVAIHRLLLLLLQSIEGQHTGSLHSLQPLPGLGGLGLLRLGHVRTLPLLSLNLLLLLLLLPLLLIGDALGFGRLSSLNLSNALGLGLL